MEKYKCEDGEEEGGMERLGNTEKCKKEKWQEEEEENMNVRMGEGGAERCSEGGRVDDEREM